MSSAGVWLARLQCTECGFVSSDDGLARVAARCPSCGHSGNSRGTYPTGSGIELLNLIDHFYQITARQHERVWEETAGAISRHVGRQVSRSAAYEGWRRANRAYSGSPDRGPELVALSRMFRCDSETALKILLSYSTDREKEAAELPMVPICTVTLIETMLSWLLRSIEPESCDVGGYLAR
jgi:hypothetical protein